MSFGNYELWHGEEFFIFHHLMILQIFIIVTYISQSGRKF